MSRKIAGLIDRLINNCILLFGILLLAIGTYSMLDNLWVYQNAADRSLKVYRPEEDVPLAEEQQITENQVGWITLDGTSVDYPVMQGTDNAMYLNKDPYGQFSLSGSIFLDCRNAGDFSDRYSLIYGHHMQGDVMFGALDAYRAVSYFDEHKTGRLVTKDNVYDYRLFAVIADDGTNQLLFDPSLGDFQDIISYVKEHAFVFEAFDENLNVLALSTCQGADTERLLLFGTLSPIAE